MPDSGLQAESLPATVKALNLAVNEVGVLVERLKRNVVTEVPEFVLQQWHGRMANQADTIHALQERIEKSDALLASRDQRIRRLVAVAEASQEVSCRKHERWTWTRVASALNSLKPGDLDPVRQQEEGK